MQSVEYSLSVLSSTNGLLHVECRVVSLSYHLQTVCYMQSVEQSLCLIIYKRFVTCRVSRSLSGLSSTNGLLHAECRVLSLTYHLQTVCYMQSVEQSLWLIIYKRFVTCRVSSSLSDLSSTNGLLHVECRVLSLSYYLQTVCYMQSVEQSLGRIIYKRFVTCRVSSSLSVLSSTNGLLHVECRVVSLAYHLQTVCYMQSVEQSLGLIIYKRFVTCRVSSSLSGLSSTNGLLHVECRVVSLSYHLQTVCYMQSVEYSLCLIIYKRFVTCSVEWSLGLIIYKRFVTCRVSSLSVLSSTNGLLHVECRVVSLPQSLWLIIYKRFVTCRVSSSLSVFLSTNGLLHVECRVVSLAYHLQTVCYMQSVEQSLCLIIYKRFATCRVSSSLSGLSSTRSHLIFQRSTSSAKSWNISTCVFQYESGHSFLYKIKKCQIYVQARTYLSLTWLRP